MTNPLIAKWEEIHGKKEEPKEVKYELPEEFITRDEYAPNTLSVTSSGSGYTNITNATVAAKPVSSFKTYDNDSSRDAFFQVVELIRKNEARVTSCSVEMDNVGSFHSGLKTVTFQVQVWSTP